jgi:bifunctional enzyme CysN/CysC
VAAIDHAAAGSTPLAAEDIGTALARLEQLELLRFITCGSVDDGKSTLIGRLLWESQNLFDDHLRALELDSRKYGTQGDNIDFALLVDGLMAEREQGITIDVAYRYFSTARRRFIVADTPGHEQYTRNMVTGASSAELALLLVDARSGIVTQTMRHAYLASLLGITRIVLAVNKMDLVDYSRETFAQHVEVFRRFAAGLHLSDIVAIPLSALLGDNISTPSKSMGWYAGPTLLGHLETVDLDVRRSERLVFPVQWVNRPDSQFRGFAGSIAEGSVAVGDDVRVTLSGQVAQIKSIVTMDGERAAAQQGQAVTLVLDREIDVSRGDVIALADQPLESTDQFEATLIWMDEEGGLVGRTYDLKLGTQTVAASITSIKYRVDVNTLRHEPASQLLLNDIGMCNVATNRPVVFDTYGHSRALGGFILIDRLSRDTVAAGLISHSLRRADNVHRQALTVARADRERLNGHRGRVIWFTGLSGSGKSSIANALEVRLHRDGYRTFLLDGDNIRLGLCKDLGFTDADRLENVRRAMEVSRLLLDAGLIVIVSLISPFRRERETARETIGKGAFLEVFVNTSLEVCEARDPKGLYRKARAGLLPNLSGIGSAYEAPETPDVEIDGANEARELAAERIIAKLELP